MFFIHPMWDTESQRLGLRRCTWIGFYLREIGEMIGFLGLFVLIAMLAIGGWKLFSGTFHAALLWRIAWPLSMGILGEAMVQCSYHLARKKSFQYDYDNGEASWIEAGERRTFKAGRRH